MSREDTPWTVGTADGFNASNIYDAQGNGIAQVFGVPMHTRLDDVDPARWEGLEKARLIVRAVNSHAEMLATLAGIAGLIGNVDHSAGGGENTARLYGGMLNDIRDLAQASIANTFELSAGADGSSGGAASSERPAAVSNSGRE